MSSELFISDVFDNYKKAFAYLLTKRKQFILVTIIFSISGFLYVSLSDNKYTAQLNFVAENASGGGLSAYAGIASQFGIDLGGGGGGAFDGDNLIELMKSKNLVSKTLLTSFDNKNLLIEFFIENHNLNSKKLDLKFNSNSTDQNWVADSMINIVYELITKKHLSIEKFDKKLDFIYIRFTDKNQFFAKKFTDVLANETIDFYTAYKNKRNASNVATIQKQVDSVRNLLYGNLEQIAETRDLNVNLIRQAPQTQRQKSEINRTVHAAVYEELQKNLQIARLIMLKETPLIKIIDSPILPLKNEKMGRLKAIVIFGFIGAFIVFVLQILSFFNSLQKKN